MSGHERAPAVGACSFIVFLGSGVSLHLLGGTADFVSGYLRWACVVSVGGSWIVHSVLLSGKGRRRS